MQIEKIVINASPLVLLFKSHFEWLLPKLFTEIIVPASVRDEVSRGEDIASHKLYDYESEWITRGLIQIPDEISVWNLGDGESEVLSRAFNNEKKYRAVIDDRADGHCAKTLDIPTLGTGGILVLAKKRGLINSVSDALGRLQNVGLYISDEITELLKKQAGEI
jgi:predicted nucleic acid-binding protein